MVGAEWIGAERLVACTWMISAVKVMANSERVRVVKYLWPGTRGLCTRDREISSIDTLSRSEESLSFPSLD
jgi:hypothetical protein